MKTLAFKPGPGRPRRDQAPAPAAALLDLSRQLGREERQLAILGEGNTSVRLDADVFLVKASGASLATLQPGGIAGCRFDALLPLLDLKNLSDTEIDAALLAARTDPAAPKPSVEAIFHAWLLTLPGIQFVGHTHPVAINALLCSKWARTFARRRLFPDEIVCCGSESVFVPYTDPGLKLAQAVRREVRRFLDRRGETPRIVLVENHGLIAIGGTPQAVLAATLMADKAARIFLGAAAAGGAPRFLTATEIARIAGRPDEHHRRRMLRI
ncbi:MAG TPA: class II aldolase/adducin family protein [Opitutaceae bacterium]|nr:class II aldolase/adducin family protein [Opitutaceae bacterium]